MIDESKRGNAVDRSTQLFDCDVPIETESRRGHKATAAPKGWYYLTMINLTKCLTLLKQKALIKFISLLFIWRSIRHDICIFLLSLYLKHAS